MSCFDHGPATQKAMCEIGAHAHARLRSIRRSETYQDLADYHQGHALRRWSRGIDHETDAQLNAAEQCHADLDAAVEEVIAETMARAHVLFGGDKQDVDLVRHALAECIADELPAFGMLVARSALYLRSAAAARQARAAALV